MTLATQKNGPTSGAHAPRSAVVDLGSNSVRLVVFEGFARNPVAIFNEKSVLRLGSGLHATGRLNNAAVEQAIQVLQRFHKIADAMRAGPLTILATAAVRDAENGPDFVARLRELLPKVKIRILTGEGEATLSAEGVLCGIPSAHGILADIGGGSLELVRLRHGQAGEAVSLKLGVIRLADRAENDSARARKIAEADLATVPWLGDQPDGTLYLVGGAFRALARLHMAQQDYKLTIVHHYAISGDEALALVDAIPDAAKRLDKKMRKQWEALVSRRRLEDLPIAAAALRGVLKQIQPRRVVFSANGLREGWYMQQLPETMRHADPMLAAGQSLAESWGRDPELPRALIEWTDPLFADDTPGLRRLREAACWMSDTGSHDHPEYRAELAFQRLILQAGVSLDHPARAFLGYVIACRYEADPDARYLNDIKALLTPDMARRAQILGTTLRLAYTLCAGTPALLFATGLRSRNGTLELSIAPGAGVLAVETVLRRLQRLGDLIGQKVAIAGSDHSQAYSGEETVVERRTGA